MGLFDDKKYDDMDDISKMVEPWESGFDDILCKLPDVFKVPPEVIVASVSSHKMDDYISNTIFKTFLNEKEIQLLSSSELLSRPWSSKKSAYEDALYEPEITTDSLTYDTLTHEVKGELVYRKTLLKMDEDRLKKLILSKIDYKLFRNRSGVYLLKETKALYEALTGKHLASKKRAEVFNETEKEIYAIFSEDKFRIRSYDLAIKFLHWCDLYCRYGDTASMANIMKLKIMTHSGRAIYSIEEEV
jgi:hypothetical protein